MKKIFPFVWVAGWIFFFVWFTKDHIDKAPKWLTILAVVLVIGVSATWLFVHTAPENKEGQK